MKKCSACGEAKPAEDFQKRSKSSDGLAGKCRPCKRAYDNAHYAAHRDSRRPYITSNREVKRELLRMWIKEYLLAHPCVDCGEGRFVLLDFDHRDSKDKTRSISDMLRAAVSRDTLLAEVQKCDVRCANCHRLRTAEQFGWKKLNWT